MKMNKTYNSNTSENIENILIQCYKNPMKGNTSPVKEVKQAYLSHR